MEKRLAVGDKVRFTLGTTPILGTILFAVGTNAVAVRLTSTTPILGTILFAVGTNAVAVRLTSGTEIIIDLDAIS